MKHFLLFTLSLFFLPSCGNPSDEILVRDWGLMGTVVSLTIFDSQDKGLFEPSFKIIQDIEGKMTNWNEDSELMEVNRNAGIKGVKVSDETLEVIHSALEVAALTDGAFDPTIGPVLSLWGIATDNPKIPTDQELAQALALVDYTQVQIQGNEVFLPKKGMRLDLGGIAKGYAADKVAAFLLERQVRAAILNFGGDVYVLGVKDDGSPWRIGIQDPWEPRGRHMAIASVGQTSVVTSGPYERYFIDPESKIRFHHIMDPVRGYPVENGLASVTIISDNSMVADGLSTGIYVMGLEAGLALAQELEGIEAMLITEDRQAHWTQGAKEMIRMSDQ